MLHTRAGSLRIYLVKQLVDLLDAERRLARALPRMVTLASTSRLKAALQKHLGETARHVQRLRQAFKQLGETPRPATSAAMRGLIDEAATMINDAPEGPIRDAVVITSAQTVEFFEMARYGAARTYARIVGAPAVAELLGETLKEEQSANEAVSQLAERSVNKAAAAEWAAEQAHSPWSGGSSRSSRRARRRRRSQ